MELFINGMACISAVNSISEDFAIESLQVPATQRFLPVIAPEYKDHIPATLLRRSSHILKMGISAGLICLKRAGVEIPDAIITGTGMGCFEDTDKFLRSIIENEERMLNPTPFIQSTHNTVAGQLALITKAKGYNFTYVHQNNSLESALVDAQMMLVEKPSEKILLGTVDELNDALKELFDRAGHIKTENEILKKTDLSESSGYIAGEGASFFLLASKKNNGSIASISALRTFLSFDSSEDLKQACLQFLKEQDLETVDLLLSGISGDAPSDNKLLQLERELQIPVLYFKELCGEHFSSSGFAVWLASQILKNKKAPSHLIKGEFQSDVQSVLIVNQYLDKQYSFILLRAC